jgi:hypothetical protein
MFSCTKIFNLFESEAKVDPESLERVEFRG